ESFTPHRVEDAPHRLPVLRVGRARLFGARLRPLR
ncbi:MAG: hypothetical protein AVDCRST_MAG03-2756, partial [uncultured Rubrobacteraceae bacterium]